MSGSDGAGAISAMSGLEEGVSKSVMSRFEDGDALPSISGLEGVVHIVYVWDRWRGYPIFYV